ncbi:hypothetical protein AN8875.2 [Aspergillus nidulans FGSC A4]|uniref:UDP-N-acetylglucosamine transporter, putative (Eurofung) n=1 Tax=Emericella nidulans (strain FGSC A4 / ATCC 38163 / CBS 112.46 / NRRL 194 / M139) TaxID=227321 RepID=Q5AS55_EMENI|nr:hypothetical protein [Aspergillus nidulans FGSC A4]EAA64089.1 hypothetical protein AN8875.2 [Aspergillus nidulans FGSC A4]CBF84758.1 TPA: UDP-N-acetylglucosamine transporter, putative (Eurofung) [Aspergillus nidulans FGSC A4]|eukprot:XP_682144.1 hypothetical protein AN8875.2 [Aspergillus nidulans FGSC A4]
MTMTTEPSARDSFVENDIRLTENGHKLKLRSGHSDPARSGGATTDLGKRRRDADKSIHNMPGIAAVAIQTAFAHWTSIILMISLIFGGCCANVFALEAIVKFANLMQRSTRFRYSRGQILSVALLTFGVVTSALADAQAKGEAVQFGGSGSSNIYSTFIGFAILALAMLLSAFQGIYADRLLLTQWRTLNSSPSLLYHIRALLNPMGHPTELPASDETAGASNSCAISTSNPAEAFLQLLVTCRVYEGFQPILANALTQYWCIRGVHLLSAKSSSLTVTIVLNIRKLVSLLLSIHLFGNALSKGVVMGAILVFVGGSLYGFEGARLRRAAQKKD